MAWFEIRIDTKEAERLDLPEGAPEVVIGRSPECDVVLPFSSVSRRHGRLRRAEVGLLLEDLGSANGTQVNGAPVGEPVLLKDQDQISFGSVQVTFVSPPPAAAPAAHADATILSAPAQLQDAVPLPENREAAVERPESGDAPIPTSSVAPQPAIAPVATATSPAPAATRPAPAAPLTATRPSMPPQSAPGEERPGMIELVAIAAGSFLVVFAVGWLVLRWL